MIYSERQNRILTMLNRLKRIEVQDLTEKLGVSEVTVRKECACTGAPGWRRTENASGPSTRASESIWRRSGPLPPSL